jgi:hypothetical protein
VAIRIPAPKLHSPGKFCAVAVQILGQSEIATEAAERVLRWAHRLGVAKDVLLSCSSAAIVPGTSCPGVRSSRPLQGKRRKCGSRRASGSGDALRSRVAAGALYETPPAQCRECASASLAKCHCNESEQHARRLSGSNEQRRFRA